MANMDSSGASSPEKLAEGYKTAGVPAKCVSGLVAANAGKPLAELAGNTEPILARLRNGEKPTEVAKSLGIHHVSFYEWLLRHCPDEWMAISSGRALARLEQAENDMDAAEDQLQVSRARESHRMGAWSLERVARKFYGDTKGGGTVTVQVNVDRSCGGELVIQGE